jgi:hypothetical protein
MPGHFHTSLPVRASSAYVPRRPRFTYRVARGATRFETVEK